MWGPAGREAGPAIGPAPWGQHVVPRLDKQRRVAREGRANRARQRAMARCPPAAAPHARPKGRRALSLHTLVRWIATPGFSSASLPTPIPSPCTRKWRASSRGSSTHWAGRRW